MAMSRTNHPENKRFPEGFAKVRLRLAREPSHPQGSQERGYDVVMPLDQSGHIDSVLWKSHRDLCRVVHYRSGEEHDLGHMVRMPGGQWKFHYDIKGNENDSQGYHFADERFVIGEYISVIEDDGSHTYRVVTVESL
jgi:hypothetical protein